MKQGTWNGQGQFPSTDEERAAQDYLPKTDGQGNVLLTAAQARDADLAVLFNGLQTTRITRMRADLAHAALDQDLQMIASKSQDELSNIRQLTREVNQPQCPVWDGCNSVGTAPRDEAIRRSTPPSSASGSSCAVTPSGNTTFLAAAFALGTVGLAQAVRRRRRGR